MLMFNSLHVNTGGYVIGYQGSPRTLLIVDDNSENRFLLECLLEPIGFKIVQAADGIQAITLAHQIKPDLVLIDIYMPLKNGLDSVLDMRRSPELQNMVIVAISASVSEADQLRSQQVGCNGFLAKPIEEEVMFDLIARLLKLTWIRREPSGSCHPVIMTD